MGYLAAAIIPALAVVKKANNDAIVIIKKPGVPMIFLAESATGVNEFLKVDGSNVPVMTKVTNVYKIVTIIIEDNIPAGIFRFRFITSSDILATLSRPSKDINIKADVFRISCISTVKNGV